MLLGSNLGDREKTLLGAIKSLQKQLEKIVELSSLYESEPWGFEHANKFLNIAVILKSAFAPLPLLQTILAIEKEFGRHRRKNTYEARTLDIDILFYDSITIKTPELNIPHKLLHKREFTLMPLVEMIPNYRHPVLNKTIRQLYIECVDNQSNTRFISATPAFLSGE